MEIKLKPFTVPNYVIGEMPQRLKGGFVEGPKWQLSELTEEVLEGLCDDFKKGVFKRAGKELDWRKKPKLTK